MSIKFLIDQYADYDLWANTRSIDRLQRETEDVLDRPVLSSFPSLRLTLLHIRDAESAWTNRLVGVPVVWPAEADRSIGNLLKYAAQLRDLVHGYDEVTLLQPVTYHDLKSNAHVQFRWQMLMHCFNHSTQHRGQVITIMRGLGLEEVPATDLVVYQRSLVR